MEGFIFGTKVCRSQWNIRNDIGVEGQGLQQITNFVITFNLNGCNYILSANVYCLNEFLI